MMDSDRVNAEYITKVTCTDDTTDSATGDSMFIRLIDDDKTYFYCKRCKKLFISLKLAINREAVVVNTFLRTIRMAADNDIDVIEYKNYVETALFIKEEEDDTITIHKYL